MAIPDIRLLVANGCSMTYGDELGERLETGWAALVARRLEAELVNLGACAGSNQRTVRLTVEKLGGLVGERGLRPDQVLVLSMWSRMNRFEIFGGERDLHGGLPENVADPGWIRIHPTYIPRRDARSIAWYKHLQNATGDRLTFLLLWTLFDSWLAEKGYHYGFLWAFDPEPELAMEGAAYLANLKGARVIGGDRLPLGGPSLFSIGQELDDLGPDRHPLERSQARYVDDHLWPWLREVLLAQPDERYGASREADDGRVDLDR
ncbi:DUF6071 family protein [Amycolatopsis sp. NPDC051102]|uniref:DUF6071 family protein n=1 Tax=Amycolatopsis sp. NPDC051102 TaxID=3155163 RepID=UPI0034327B69